MDQVRRRRRYQDWTEFFSHAATWFGVVADTDPRFREFNRFYSFAAVKGGRQGGQDLHLVEVFFGFRPADRTTEVFTGDDRMPHVRHRLITESGASLEYRRLLNGLVACYLAPAWSDGNSLAAGEVYQLGRYEPAELTLTSTLLYRHFAYLMAYFECTSIDGTPSLSDRLRTAYLMLTKVRFVGHEKRPRRIAIAAKRFVGFALTVGLSGFLLLLVQRFFPAP